MQGKKLCTAICGLVAAVLTTQASAIMSIPIGWYLEFNGGSTHLSNSNIPGKTSSSGLGGNLDLGYKFFPFLAAELGYTLYAGTNVKNNQDQNVADIKFYSYDLTFKGILPLADSGAEAFAKLGIARLTATTSINNAPKAAQLGVGSGSHSTTNLYVAIGMQYYFTPEFAANVQWARAKGSNSTGTMDLISIGVSFIFE